jgi:hypothetical protein
MFVKAKNNYLFDKKIFFYAEITFFHAGFTSFRTGRCSVKKSNSSVKKSNSSVKKSSSSVKEKTKNLFFTLEKKSRYAEFGYVTHVSRCTGAYLTYLELSTGKDKQVIVFLTDVKCKK